MKKNSKNLLMLLGYGERKDKMYKATGWKWNMGERWNRIMI
jgi:hypothetical protein